jgi:hypothetical protein
MKTNANVNLTRTVILRLLRVIRDMKSKAIHYHVASKVLGHSWRASEFDSLLNDELLRDAIVMVFVRRKNRRAGKRTKVRPDRVHREFAIGRPGRLYKLTLKGHALLKRLLKQQADERAALAQSRELAAQARAAGAAHRAEAKIKRDAAGATRKAVRAAQEQAKRTEGFVLPAAPPERIYRPAPPSAPLWPTPVPPSVWQPAVVRPQAPWIPAQASPAAVARVVGPAGSSIIERIKKAGYTVDPRAGKALYAGNQWLTPAEWKIKMPHISLD